MTVQEIEATIMQLPMDELLELSTWLEGYQARMWDKQIEDDLASGRLDEILKEVDAEYEAGLARSL